MANPSGQISFVIPAFNEATQLPHTLAALERAAGQPGFPPYEVIVCDNASTDSTAEVASSFGARVVQEPIRQISRSRNAGASAACGDWLVFLDADSRVSRALLHELLRRINSGCCGAGGARVEFETDDLKWFPATVLTAWNLVSLWARWAAGSFLFCRRDAFESIGGFSHEFFAGEELDLSIRLQQWCGARQLKMQIIWEQPICTSARKIEGRKTWQLMNHLAILLPGALKSPEKCAFWYDPQYR
ncbi:MAG: glycosyltransferase [Candidatus Methylacidiphilales bacterium]